MEGENDIGRLKPDYKILGEENIFIISI